MSKASSQFKVNKNKIGWINSDFIKEFGNDELEKGKVLKFQKLTHSMTDSEIIKEFGIQECTLGDVLETLKNAPEELKDGYSNIFYIKGHPSRVVDVRWLGGHGGWRVRDWRRGDNTWSGGTRVFSGSLSLIESFKREDKHDSQSLEFCECKRCGQCGKVIK